MSGKTYVVKPGDCITSIAQQFGHFWETIWDCEENQELRELRQNPNALLAGDKVFVPNIRRKTLELATGEEHTFIVKGVPSKVRVRLRDGDQANKDLPFTLTLDNGTVIEGYTDSDGLIEATVPPNARRARLELDTDFGCQTMELKLGHLDPVNEVTGVQQRLHNLGLLPLASGKLDDATKQALALFQAGNDLEVTQNIDDPTVNKLAEVCGS